VEGIGSSVEGAATALKSLYIWDLRNCIAVIVMFFRPETALFSGRTLPATPKADESTPTHDRFAVVESGSIPAFDVGGECSNRFQSPSPTASRSSRGLVAILHWPPRQVRNRP
jgi:hypothetical protein